MAPRALLLNSAVRPSPSTCVALALTAALALGGCGDEPRDEVASSGASGGTGVSATAGSDSASSTATASGTAGSSGATAGTGSGTTSSTGTAGTSTASGSATDASSGVRFDVPQGGTDTTTGDTSAGGEGCEFIDVLFVVDISASMSQEQENLDENFPEFVRVLDEYVAGPSAAIGYRVGVTNSSVNANYDGCTTTMGFDGALHAGGPSPFGGGNCSVESPPWIDGPAPDVTARFSCLAENPIPLGGGSDCGKERPLDVVAQFVDKAAPGGPNAGFYRGDSSLLVVVNLTDEDDDVMWTTTSPAQAKAALDTFAGGEERYVVVTIAGPPPSSCMSAFGSAAPAVRLQEFTDLAPNGLFGNICEGDLANSLQQALQLITASCDTLPPPAG